MAGISLSLLRVDDDRLARLDAATDAPAWPKAAAPEALGRNHVSPPSRPKIRSLAPTRKPETPLGAGTLAAIEAAAESLIAAASRLTELDQLVGDGDLGINLERGARAIREALAQYPVDDPPATLHALGLTLQETLGGTSGPLYAVFLLRVAARLKSHAWNDPRVWAKALLAGYEAIAELGGAALGDRTMLDALIPAVDDLPYVHLRRPFACRRSQSRVRRRRSRRSRHSRPLPRRGRSSYLGSRAIGHPDPGAIAVATWIKAIAG